MTLFERAVAQLQANVPLLLAAGLAGFTWWLIQATPKDAGPAQAKKLSSKPDYELSQATVARFDAEGRLQAVIDGRSIRHYPIDDELRIDNMVLSARDAKGQGLHAVAQQGSANGRAERVEIRGGAKVVATPASSPVVGGKALRGPVRLSGELFQVDTRHHVLVSEQPVMMAHESGQIHAEALRYDQSTGITELKGRVTGFYRPVAP